MKKPNILLILSVSLLIGCIFTTSMIACNKEPKLEENTSVEQLITEKEKTTKDMVPDVTTEKEKTTVKESVKTETTTQKKITPNPSKKPITTKPQSTTKAEKTTVNQVVTTKAPATTKPNTIKTTTKPQQTTKPATTKPQVTKENTTIKQVETTAAPVKYSCGAANHRCVTKEEHSFIKSLEAKGCPTCGSHSCRSFYSVDENGNNCYDMTRCPKYSTKHDPLINCEFCGKPCGVGDNGTCVRFTVDTKCPGCGTSVKAKTCHSH